ncbi:hypothetical protein [Yoonia sp.]|uniref:hypothetical protein n=1 Tax=Yoonia sp. TaxID=2212373 RepID=UPI0035900D36
MAQMLCHKPDLPIKYRFLVAHYRAHQGEMLTKSGPLSSFFLLIFVAPAQPFSRQSRAKDPNSVLLLRKMKSSAVMLSGTCGKNVAAACICVKIAPDSTANTVQPQVLPAASLKTLAGALISTT